MQELGLGVKDPNYRNPFSDKQKDKLKTEVSSCV